MVKVILDTNFLIYCAENKIDYKIQLDSLMNEGYELVVPSGVVSELKEIYSKAQKFSDRTAAWMALKLLEHNHIQVISGKSGYADDDILGLRRIGDVIATLDLELRKKLSGNRIIVIKGIKKLAFD
jgi:rRNA-processing protein FCF1